MEYYMQQNLRVNTLKWCATLCLIVGFGAVSAGFINWIWLQMLGGTLWLIAAVLMQDKPLIVTNSVMTAAGVLGLLYRYFSV
jgi:hypothetical protein